jgi:predicted nucleic acid-binding protein
MPKTPDRPFFLFDASVIYAGVLGTGASASILSTVQLGGMSGITVENAMDEVRIHLMAHFNSQRSKLHSGETDRILKDLRGAAGLRVMPWITAEPSLLPDNRKDAYLLAAADLYHPRILLTLDNGLIALGSHGETTIGRPKVLLEMIDELDLEP